MTQRERNRPDDESDDRTRERGPGDGPDPADSLDAVRERTHDLLRAGRAVIAQAVSADSEGYVGRMVQEGGQ